MLAQQNNNKFINFTAMNLVGTFLFIYSHQKKLCIEMYQFCKRNHFLNGKFDKITKFQGSKYYEGIQN